MSKRPVALITGPTSGIGLHLAELLARDGYDLVLVARSTEVLARLTHDWTQKYAIRVLPISVDLSRSDAVETVVTTTREHGMHLNVLVNNAGVGSYGMFVDTPLNHERTLLQLNVLALTELTKSFLPDLRKSKGHILNVASTAAFEPGPFMAVYYASKAYVLSFSEAIAEELAPEGIQVTALCPGLTRSGFQHAANMEHSGLLRLPGMDAQEVAEAGYRAMCKGKRVVIPGIFNRLLVASVRFTPRRWITRIVAWLSQPKQQG